LLLEHAYQSRLEELDGPDSDDLHRVAAAFQARADIVLTWNFPDFPAEALASHGTAVSSSALYLCALLERFPEQVLRTVTRMAAEKKRPPMTALDLAAKLERARVPAFAGRLRRLLNEPTA
jgi:hypothetical protein